MDQEIKIGDLVGITHVVGVFDHGCMDYAIAEYLGDGKAKIVEAQNCTSCWQVGHDAGHVFANIGEHVTINGVMPANSQEWSADVTWQTDNWEYTA
jgi:hypothetical protein